jgi:hypothetical protein
MHTAMVLLAGFALLGSGLVIARIIGKGDAPTMVSAARAFIPVWFVAALLNLWMGVTRAGYSLAAEAPIFAIVFALPAGVAFLLWRHFAAQSSGTQH